MEYNVFHSNTSGKQGVRPLSSVLKTLGLIDIIARQAKPARLIDIANAAGMSRGTTHQKLITLAQAGWIEQNDNLYRLSLHATQIANAALQQANLGERVVSFLEKLVEQAQETASLAVIDGTSACIVQRVESTGVLRANLHIGALLNMTDSASGRVLAAFAKDHIIEDWRRRKVALPDAKVLSQVRREKFSISSGKSFDGVRAIGAPIFNSRGECVAALSLVGPVSRFNIDRLRPLIERSAQRISEHLKAGAP